MYCLLAIEENVTLEQLELFISYTTGFDDDFIRTITKENFQNIYQNMVNTNNNRAVETIKNPWIKWFYKLLYK